MRPDYVPSDARLRAVASQFRRLAAVAPDPTDPRGPWLRLSMTMALSRLPDEALARVARRLEWLDECEPIAG